MANISTLSQGVKWVNWIVNHFGCVIWIATPYSPPNKPKTNSVSPTTFVNRDLSIIQTPCGPLVREAFTLTFEIWFPRRVYLGFLLDRTSRAHVSACFFCVYRVGSCCFAVVFWLRVWACFYGLTRWGVSSSRARTMTMKDWDKKRISQYFDTTELLKLVNDSTQTDKAEPQKRQISLSKTKMKRKHKVERARRILPVMHHHSSKR